MSEEIEAEIAQGRARVMRRLQEQIRMMLVNAGMASENAHTLSEDLLRAVMLSDVTDDCYAKQYKGEE